MGAIIEKLRKYNGYSGESWDDTHEEIEGILYDVRANTVSTEFEEGSRWSNYQTAVYEVTEGDDVAYFSELREVPASETQDGMDCSYDFNEVYPKQVVTTIYVQLKEAL